MAPTPPLTSRKIAFEGAVLEAIEQRAATHDTSYKLAATELIELALAIGATTAAPAVIEDLSDYLAGANTGDLFAELQARFQLALSDTLAEVALQDANARADAAEAKLESMKALLG